MKTQSLRKLFITFTVAMAMLAGIFGALQSHAQAPGGKQAQAAAFANSQIAKWNISGAARLAPHLPATGERLSQPRRVQDNIPPVADFTIDPPQGVVGTEFFFDPGNSHDTEDAVAWLLTRFDFDGDGTWDTSWDNPTNAPPHHTYSASGTYHVKLEVKDTGNLTGTRVITLQVGNPGSNTAPTADCAVSPSSGFSNTVFTFSATGSSDTQDATSALQVKWDRWGGFDFRGQNWQSATQSVTFTYTTLGIHNVDLIVMDSGYLMDNTSCQIEVVSPEGNISPTASLVITPTTGTMTTTFTMNVQGSTDDHDAIADMSVRFDWTDDGVYDTGWLNASQLWQNTFTYVFGQITVRAQIRDSGGLTDEATQTIYVDAPYHVYLPLVLR